MPVYFTSDTHFYHANIIKYCLRPFKDVDDMNNVLIQKWNSRVTKNDTIYHLGDFSFGKSYYLFKDLLSKLNGKKIFIEGNHDDTDFFIRARDEGLIEDFRQAMTIKVEDKIIYLSHFGHRVWDRSHHQSYHLYGHSHGKLEDYGLSTDAGVDSWNYAPVSFYEIREKFRVKEEEIRNGNV